MGVLSPDRLPVVIKTKKVLWLRSSDQKVLIDSTNKFLKLILPKLQTVLMLSLHNV